MEKRPIPLIDWRDFRRGGPEDATRPSKIKRRESSTQEIRLSDVPTRVQAGHKTMKQEG